MCAYLCPFRYVSMHVQEGRGCCFSSVALRCDLRSVEPVCMCVVCVFEVNALALNTVRECDVYQNGG